MTSLPRSLTSADDIIAAGLAPEAAHGDLKRVGARYAIAITPAIVRLIDPADADDPIARQFVPDRRELDTHPGEVADPIGDTLKSPAPGLVHRYPDRVLLKIASVCPVYCRFCFRREMVGPANGEALSAGELEAALDYIRANPAIWEVILTGGDPFILSPRRIGEVTTALGEIAHVRVLRWHTRVPIVDPERVKDALINALKSSRRAVFVGLHANHVRELTAMARAAISLLIDAGIPVVSQTVLLRGVNDDVESLEALFRALVGLRVKPYYLHHGDLAPGTAHFRVPIARGRELTRTLRQRLSGLALPTYVLDLPGAHGKVPLESFASDKGDGTYAVHDAHGAEHRYEDVCAAPDVP